MEMITVNLPASCLDDVKVGLVARGVARIRIAAIKGYVEGREEEIVWRGCHSFENLLPEYELEAVVCHTSVDEVVDFIMKTVGQRRGGDGFVCVTPVGECYRIRTGEPQF
jgi:nitrogen regulatory protein PII